MGLSKLVDRSNAGRGSLPVSQSGTAGGRQGGQAMRPQIRIEKPRSREFCIMETLGIIFAIVVLHTIVREPLRKLNPLIQLIRKQRVPWPGFPKDAAADPLIGSHGVSTTANPTVDTEASENDLHYVCDGLSSNLSLTKYINPRPGISQEPAVLSTDVLDALSSQLDPNLPACGLLADDVTMVVMLYHKMGTVWWQHALRVTDFASPLSIFVVDSGKGLEFLEAAAALATAHKGLKKRFPAVIMMNNPKLADVERVHDWTLAASRVPRFVLQVRDFRDVLVSGYRYHLKHSTSDETPETWLHTPQSWWGSAVNSSTPLAYQDALKLSSASVGASLEMKMVSGTWGAIAALADNPLWENITVVTTYEDMWSTPGDVILQLVEFIYGDVTCNPSAKKMAQGFLAYTAGFRTISTAAAEAAAARRAFDLSLVDLHESIDLLQSVDSHMSSERQNGLSDFLQKTYGNAGRHAGLHKGTPGNWKVDPLFSMETRALFANQFQCLLDKFRYEAGTGWVHEAPDAPKSSNDAVTAQGLQQGED